MSMHRHSDDLGGVFRRHRWRLVLAVVLLFTTMVAGTALLGLSGGFLTAAALAGAAGIGNGFNFFSPSAGIRGLTMARIVSRYFEKLVGHDVTLRIARDLRVWFFRRALPLAPARLAATRTGELMARLMSDIADVDGLLVRAIGPLLALAGLALAGTAAAWLIHPPAALLLAALSLLVGICVPLLGVRGAQPAEDQRVATRARLRTLAFEGLEGCADLSALHAREDWQLRVHLAARQLGVADARRRRRLITANLAHGVFAAAGLVGMLWLALQAFEDGAIAADWAAALVFLTVAMLEIAAGAGLAWQSLLSGRVAAARLEAIVDQPDVVVDAPVPKAAAAAGVLQLDDVAFAWPGQARPLFSGVSLRLEPGERIAIIGDSGSGKTTLGALLLRLWDPSTGSLRWGGDDLRALAQSQWHERIAWLPQNAPVFAGTIAENLRLGAPAADDDALWDALDAVRLSDWAQVQGGLQAWVGENGATMSAGQARRLALARALLRRAPVLLLDEPTEGLDVDTANALLHDMVAALDGRTLVMITHASLPDGIVHARYRLQDGELRAV